MGQAAGIKRRNAKTGSYNVLKNRKSDIKKKRTLHKAGLKFLGLEEDGRQCLLTRIQQGGLVADLRNFDKPDRNEALVGPGVKILEKSSKKDKKHKKKTPEMVKTLEGKRNEVKDRANSRREIHVPKSQAQRMAYYLDKYGEDYKAMVSDPMNYDQYTWKQLRAQVQSFKNTTYQFASFLADRGIMNQLKKDAAEQKEILKAEKKSKKKNKKSAKDVSDEAGATEGVEFTDDLVISDNDNSDGEYGQNFMAKVRALEGDAMEASDESENEAESESEEPSSSESSQEGEKVEVEGGETAAQSALSQSEKKQQNKRRLRAKNFKLAKKKRVQKAKRTIGMK